MSCLDLPQFDDDLFGTPNQRVQNIGAPYLAKIESSEGVPAFLLEACGDDLTSHKNACDYLYFTGRYAECRERAVRLFECLTKPSHPQPLWHREAAELIVRSGVRMRDFTLNAKYLLHHADSSLDSEEKYIDHLQLSLTHYTGLSSNPGILLTLQRLLMVLPSSFPSATANTAPNLNDTFNPILTGQLDSSTTTTTNLSDSTYSVKSVLATYWKRLAELWPTANHEQPSRYYPSTFSATALAISALYESVCTSPDTETNVDTKGIGTTKFVCNGILKMEMEKIKNDNEGTENEVCDDASVLTSKRAMSKHYSFPFIAHDIVSVHSRLQGNETATESVNWHDSETSIAFFNIFVVPLIDQQVTKWHLSKCVFMK